MGGLQGAGGNFHRRKPLYSLISIYDKVLPGLPAQRPFPSARPPVRSGLTAEALPRKMDSSFKAVAERGSMIMDHACPTGPLAGERVVLPPVHVAVTGDWSSVVVDATLGRIC
ncbi:hypothetical protein NY78_4111 [Desulfovibrio sp. TomC]|nr:hypothetical protein NY78_4111 [Desulfovibrio sp. TomC]